MEYCSIYQEKSMVSTAYYCDNFKYGATSWHSPLSSGIRSAGLLILDERSFANKTQACLYAFRKVLHIDYFALHFALHSTLDRMH